MILSSSCQLWRRLDRPGHAGDHDGLRRCYTTRRDTIDTDRGELLLEFAEGKAGSYLEGQSGAASLRTAVELNGQLADARCQIRRMLVPPCEHEADNLGIIVNLPFEVWRL